MRMISSSYNRDPTVSEFPFNRNRRIICQECKAFNVLLFWGLFEWILNSLNPSNFTVDLKNSPCSGNKQILQLSLYVTINISSSDSSANSISNQQEMVSFVCLLFPVTNKTMKRYSAQNTCKDNWLGEIKVCYVLNVILFNKFKHFSIYM